jgi:hypothetical protein
MCPQGNHSIRYRSIKKNTRKQYLIFKIIIKIIQTKAQKMNEKKYKKLSIELFEKS